MRSILHRIPPSEEVELEGFVRYRIRGADFPGIYPKKDERIDGTLFTGITAEEMDLLDSYESDLYVRKEVPITHSEETTSIAFAYVLPPEHESICTEEPWDLKTFHP